MLGPNGAYAYLVGPFTQPDAWPGDGHRPIFEVRVADQAGSWIADQWPDIDPGSFWSEPGVIRWRSGTTERSAPY